MSGRAAGGRTPGAAAAPVTAALLLVLGGAALVIRPVWHDELFTLALAQRPLAGIVAALRVDSGPPGHYLLARLLTLLGGGALPWLRVPSLLGVAGGAAVLVAAVRRLKPAAAWPAAALLAGHPLLVVAAAEARAYGLLFGCVAAVVALLAGVVDRRRAIVLGLLLAAACWLHALGLVVTGAVCVAALLFPPAERRRVWLAALAALAAILPWLPVMARQPAAAVAWMGDAWAGLPWWRWLLPVLEPAPGFVPAAWGGPIALPVVIVAVAAAWLVLVAVGARRGESARAPLAMWVATAAVLLGVTATARPLWAVGRSALVVIAPAVVVAAIGGARLRRLGEALVAVLAGCALWASAGALVSWSTPAPEPAAAAADALGAAAPGDVVVTTGWWSLDVHNAVGERAATLRWLTFPASVADHPGWYDDADATVAGPAAAARLEAVLAGARRDGRRVWLLRSPRLPSDRLLTPVAGALGLVQRAGWGPYWQLWGPPPSQER